MAVGGVGVVRFSLRDRNLLDFYRPLFTRGHLYGQLRAYFRAVPNLSRRSDYLLPLFFLLVGSAYLSDAAGPGVAPVAYVLGYFMRVPVGPVFTV